MLCAIKEAKPCSWKLAAEGVLSRIPGSRLPQMGTENVIKVWIKVQNRQELVQEAATEGPEPVRLLYAQSRSAQSQGHV